MTDERKSTWRYLGIFLLGCILLSHPVMTIFNVSVFIFGIPLLFLYIFLCWLIVIFLIREVSEKLSGQEAQNSTVANTRVNEE